MLICFGRHFDYQDENKYWVGIDWKDFDGDLACQNYFNKNNVRSYKKNFAKHGFQSASTYDEVTFFHHPNFHPNSTLQQLLSIVPGGGLSESVSPMSPNNGSTDDVSSSEGSMDQQVFGDDSGLSDGDNVFRSEGYMDQQDTSEGDDSNGLNDDGALNYP